MTIYAVNKPWEQHRQIQYALEVAAKNGFSLRHDKHGREGIAIYAAKSPYAKDTVIKVLPTWESVCVWFDGYEQAFIELTVGKKP